MKLRREYDYYQREKRAICKKLAGRYVVIVGEEIIGDYATQRKAIEATRKQHALGDFFVKLAKYDEDPAYIPRMQVKKVD